MDKPQNPEIYAAFIHNNLDEMEVHIIDEEILRCTRGAKDGDISHMG